MSGKFYVVHPQVQRQLISLHRLITSKDRPGLTNLIRTAKEIDITLPLRGVTALSLTLYLKLPDMTRDVLTLAHKLGQSWRALNLSSTDNAGRRETPLTTAARMGLMDATVMMLHYK